MQAQKIRKQKNHVFLKTPFSGPQPIDVNRSETHVLSTKNIKIWGITHGKIKRRGLLLLLLLLRLLRLLLLLLLLLLLAAPPLGPTLYLNWNRNSPRRRPVTIVTLMWRLLPGPSKRGLKWPSLGGTTC